jgi:hypothetical protein
MEKVLDYGAAIVFVLVIPSVVRAVRIESGDDVSPLLSGLVALFVILMGIVFMSAASQLASGVRATQVVLLVFFIVIVVFVRTAWTSKPAD